MYNTSLFVKHYFAYYLLLPLWYVVKDIHYIWYCDCCLTLIITVREKIWTLRRTISEICTTHSFQFQNLKFQLRKYISVLKLVKVHTFYKVRCLSIYNTSGSYGLQIQEYFKTILKNHIPTYDGLKILLTARSLSFEILSIFCHSYFCWY